MTPIVQDFERKLARRGISRRDFIRYCGAVVATLALPTQAIDRVARALATTIRPPLVWLEFQDCTGDTESFLRTSSPGIDDLLLETISLDYHETLMVPAGAGTEKSLLDTVEGMAGQYICIVEGSIPIRDGGVYCAIRGRTAQNIARQVCGSALATIATGTCAWDGGLAAAAPNPTGAVGVRTAVPGLANLVNLPGCPVNAVNLTATLVHYLTFNEMPATDSRGRPRFAYSEEVHKECERHDYYERDQFVLEWGDEGHRKGWCLRKMGCKGPQTHSNCPSVLWNDGTSWPIGAGHGCIGCTEQGFWDRYSPFYRAGGDDDD